MLLGRPWLRDAKVAHDWGSNIVTIQGNGTAITITVTKRLGGEGRRPKMLFGVNACILRDRQCWKWNNC
jgi:hypothetical protein